MNNEENILETYRILFYFLKILNKKGYILWEGNQFKLCICENKNTFDEWFNEAIKYSYIKNVKNLVFSTYPTITLTLIMCEKQKHTLLSFCVCVSYIYLFKFYLHNFISINLFAFLFVERLWKMASWRVFRILLKGKYKRQYYKVIKF